MSVSRPLQAALLSSMIAALPVAVSHAQIEPRALYKGEMLPIVRMDGHHVQVTKDGEEFEPLRSKVEIEPAKEFGAGFVTLKDTEVDYGRKTGGGSPHFNYTTELVADRELNDCYGVLFFVSNGSIGSHWIPIGGLSAGRSRAVEVELREAVDEVVALHVFSHGRELRSTAVPGPYDIREQFAAVRSRWKGIPAIALCETDLPTCLRLSDDGTRLFMAQERDNDTLVSVLDVDAMKLLCSTKVGDYSTVVETPVWIRNDAVAFSCDGHLKLLSVAKGTCEDLLEDVRAVWCSMGSDPDSVVVMGYKSIEDGSWVEKFNVRTRKAYDFIDPYPGYTLVDDHGELRFRYDFDGAKFSYYFRPTRTSHWRNFDGNAKPENLRLGVNGKNLFERVADFEGLSPDGNTAYLSTRLGSDCFELSAFDMEKACLRNVVAKVPGYDLDGDGSPLFHLYFDRKTSALLGLTYDADLPRVAWMDPRCRKIQQAIERVFPGQACIPEAFSDDRSTFVYLVFSDRAPGTFYLFRPYQGILVPVLQIGASIDTKQTCAMTPFDFKARDGATIHAYLTEPNDAGGKAPPLIVYIHGGPMARDFWGFQSVVQFLATRGYAVLQVNYRGSSGFGRKYQMEGLHARLDTVVIDDIVDGVRAAVTQGKADPSRVGVMGASFGGWATYLCLASYPRLFRAGVAISAVSHWMAIQRRGRWQLGSRMSYSVWQSILDRESFARDEPIIDPVLRAGDIKQPVYVMHGTWDAVVPDEQAHQMVEALKKNGGDVRSKIFMHSTHSDWSFDDRVTMLNEVGSFFREKLAPVAAASHADARVRTEVK